MDHSSKNVPNLRNLLMEMRKLCCHPYLCDGLEVGTCAHKQPYSSCRAHKACVPSWRTLGWCLENFGDAVCIHTGLPCCGLMLHVL